MDLRSLTNRARAASLGLALAATGCSWFDCHDPRYSLSSPRATLESFHRAIRCDDAKEEYFCFSARVQQSFGSFSGYSLGREILKERDPLALHLLRNADLDGRLRVEIERDGVHAAALLDIGAQEPLEIRLVLEAEYRLHHADGKTTVGFAETATPRVRRDGLTIEVNDPAFELESKAAPQRVELLERWVIDDFPGLSAAVESARGGG
jgi:hypothetical protein